MIGPVIETPRGTIFFFRSELRSSLRLTRSTSLKCSRCNVYQGMCLKWDLPNVQAMCLAAFGWFCIEFCIFFFPLLSFLCVLSFALFSLLSLCAYFVTVVNVKFPFLKVKISNGRRVRKSTEKILDRMVSIFGLHATLTTGASCITLWARTSTTTLRSLTSLLT